jgi:chromosomal replication initiation ATPase DnaA
MSRILKLARDRARLMAESIGAELDIDPEEILGRRRHKPIAAARHRLYAELFLDGFSIAEVGTILERHHTTVMYGMRQAMGDAAYERELEARYPLSGWRQTEEPKPSIRKDAA